MFFVNWEKDISILQKNDDILVMKKNKPFKKIRELILMFMYTIISCLTINPTIPPITKENSINNEGFEIRKKLKEIGIDTPNLISIEENNLIEEYIDGGNLYTVFEKKSNKNIKKIAYQAGILTGKLHKDGYVFIDNKSQNFLIKKNTCKIFRTDLGFIHLNNSIFARSLDIGSFLASIMDLEYDNYITIERNFIDGYYKIFTDQTPYLSVLLRNLLAIGFTSNNKNTLGNMIKKTGIYL